MYYVGTTQLCLRKRPFSTPNHHILCTSGEKSGLDGPTVTISTASRSASVVTDELKIEGMTCERCAAAIKSKLLECPGVVAAEVDYPAGRARVKYDSVKIDPAKLIEVVNAGGYRAALIGGGNPTREDRP
jgi:copper chaperone